MASEQRCPYCGGTGAVTGVVDDIEFTFQCPCEGGSVEPVHWLLGSTGKPPTDRDWII